MKTMTATQAARNFATQSMILFMLWAAVSGSMLSHSLSSPQISIA